MKEKTDHHKSCLEERKKGIEILRGKYTQIWRIKMKKFAFKTKGKKKRGKEGMGEKNRLPCIKPDLNFSSPSNIYLSLTSPPSQN